MTSYLTRSVAAAVLIIGATGAANAQINFDRGSDFAYTGGGALIGGIIGSNVAGGGVQDEGTAIGAVIGGLAGNYIGNRVQARQDAQAYYGGGYGYQGGYAGNYAGSNGNSYGGSSRYGDYNVGVPSAAYGYEAGGRYGYSQSSYNTGGYIGGGYAPAGYHNSGYSSRGYSIGGYGAGGGVYTTPGGYVAGPIQTQSYSYVTQAPVTAYRAAVVTPHYVSPAYTPPTTHSTSSYRYSSTPMETAPCPAGSTMQSNGTCLQSASTHYSSSSYSSGASYTSTPHYSSATHVTTSMPASCPAGTTPQSNGTCLQTGSAYISQATSTHSSCAASHNSHGHNTGHNRACDCSSH